MAERDDNIQDVLETMSALNPSPGDEPVPAVRALASLRPRLSARPANASGQWRWLDMFRRRYVWVTALVVVALVATFSFPGVRALASDFLGLFRVEKFTALSVAPEQLAVLEEIAESGVMPGELIMDQEPGPPQVVDGLEAAAAVANFSPRSPAALEEPYRVEVIPGGSGRLIVDVPQARAFMTAASVDPSLVPDSIDGESVSVTVYSAIVSSWDNGLTLVQMPSPLVAYPEEVDEEALARALLQILGMGEREAARLAASIDWTTTLIVPIPSNMASFAEVTVDGVPGLLLSSLDGQNAGLLWQKDGVVYALDGGDVDWLLAVADSLP